MNSKSINVGISVGDINGIGMEIIMKTLSDSRTLEGITPIVYGSTKLASFYKNVLELPQFSFKNVKDATEARRSKPNLINLWEEEVQIDMGESTEEGGTYAFKSLQAATEDLASGKVDVLVTAPINKHNMQSEDFNFNGHTEYLTEYANASESLMLMVDDKLKIGVVTNHIPLKEVADVLTKELIVTKAKLLANTLIKDFGIIEPKIAILGLNPHAGDDGLLGEEEEGIIIPALEALNNEGVMAFGPYAADGIFGSKSFSKFDGILAMYHDQGLVPFKAISGGNGVNFTAGLPIVRTSPDHGTAYDITGENIASETSFRNALFAAVDIYKYRNNYKEMTADTLKIQKRKPNHRER